MERPEPPIQVLTFLFADVEGSTRLPRAMARQPAPPWRDTTSWQRR